MRWGRGEDTTMRTTKKDFKYSKGNQKDICTSHLKSKRVCNYK
jgi:hypothetical protein